ARAVYDRALLGALGGLTAWLLYGAFGDPETAADGSVWQQLSAGAISGGAVGYLVAGGPAGLRGLWLRATRWAAYGSAFGLIGGLLGCWHGPGLGWVALGLAVGVSEGLAARAVGLLVRGALGGALGGAMGGL